MQFPTFYTTIATISVFVLNHATANPLPGGELARTSPNKALQPVETPKTSTNKGPICKVNLMSDDISKTAQSLDSAYAGDTVEINWQGYNMKILVQKGCAGEKISGAIPRNHYVLITPFFAVYPKTIIRDDGAYHKHYKQPHS